MAAKELPQTEREIHNLIQRLDNLSTTIFKDEKDHLKETEEKVKYLRQQMRKIRRWRNGSEKPSKQHVTDIQRELEGTRKRWLMLEFQTLIQSSKRLLTTEPLNRVLVQASLEYLQEKLENMPQCQTDLAEIDILFIETRALIEKIQKDDGSPDTICTNKLKETDENYNVLSQKAMQVRVLTMMRKLRSLLMGLSKNKNGHQSVIGAASCAANDIDALGRQLRRVRKWLHGKQEVREYHIEDMELILAALGRHVKMDVLLSCENEVDSDEEELGSLLMSNCSSWPDVNNTKKDGIVTVDDKEKSHHTITDTLDENDNSKCISDSHLTKSTVGGKQENKNPVDKVDQPSKETMDERLI